MFKRLKKKIKNKLNNYFNNLLDPKLNDISNKIDLKKDETIDDVRRLIKASIVNKETFGPYKDYCKGKKLVICGAGPSLNKYKPIPGAIHIALNRAFFFDKVHFDFIFSCDFKGLDKYVGEFNKYVNCIKLIGDFSDDISIKLGWQWKEYLLHDKNIKRYFLNSIKNNMKFIKDIDCEPLSAFPLVGLTVLQFALFMNPDELYLVGYDLSGNHFTNIHESKEEINKSEYGNNIPSEWYKLFYSYLDNFIIFKNYHYPHLKIFSINPVKLKGYFNDIYN